jgi:hypothetical protein
MPLKVRVLIIPALNSCGVEMAGSVMPLGEVYWPVATGLIGPDPGAEELRDPLVLTPDQRLLGEEDGGVAVGGERRVAVGADLVIHVLVQRPDVAVVRAGGIQVVTRPGGFSGKRALLHLVAVEIRPRVGVVEVALVFDRDRRKGLVRDEFNSGGLLEVGHGDVRQRSVDVNVL